MAAPGAMTQEEFYKMLLEAQLGKGNLAAMGKEADRQDVYAQQLRAGAGKGLDVAGNLSRALAGAGAGWQEREAAKTRKGIASKEEAFFNDWKNRLGASAPPIAPAAAAPPAMPPPMEPPGGVPGGMMAPPPQATGMGILAPAAGIPPGPPPGQPPGAPPMAPPGADMSAPQPPQPPAPPQPPGGPQMTPNPNVTPDASDLFQMLLKKKKDEEAGLMGMV